MRNLAASSDCFKTRSLAAELFIGASKFVDAAWDAITVEDFRYPQTRGQRPKGYALSKWLNRQFFALAAIDKEFCVAFTKVIQLVEPPESILKPKYLFKALFAKMPSYDREPPFSPEEAGDDAVANTVKAST